MKRSIHNHDTTSMYDSTANALHLVKQASPLVLPLMMLDKEQCDLPIFPSPLATAGASLAVIYAPYSESQVGCYTDHPSTLPSLMP